MKTKLTLDVNKSTYAQLTYRVTGRMGDVASNTVDVYVVNNGVPYPLTNLTVFYECRKPDYTAVRDGKGVRIIDAANGHFEYTFPSEVFSAPGETKHSFFSIEKEKQVRATTQDFGVRILSDALTGYGLSDHYISEFERLKEESKNVDKKIDEMKKLFEEAIENGGVTPEVIAAREDVEGEKHKTLKERNDSDYKIVSTQIQKNTQDIDHYSTLFEMRRQQTLLLGLCYQKLQRKQPITINCKGDSITYGLDLYSQDKRPADPEQPDPNSTRASTTYPEFFQTIMDKVYPELVGIEKFSKPGMTAEAALEAWVENNQADLTLLMLGTNDATYGGLKAFSEAYRKLIERELSWNTAVIMLLPPKQKSVMDAKTDVFRGVLIQLAKEYGIPCLDLGEELLNIPASFYSDVLHFNGDGYKFLAAKIANFFINGACLYPTKVTNRSLLIRERTDGVLLIDKYSVVHYKKNPTSDDIHNELGIALSMSPGAKILYSVYTEQDNIVCFPAAFLGKTNTAFLQLTLDFGVKTQRISNTNRLGMQSSGLSYEPSQTYTTPKDGNFYPVFYQTRWGAFTTNISGIRSLDEKMIVIPKAGYHTILVENTSEEEFTFYGLDFKPYDDVVNQVFARTPNAVTKSISSGSAAESQTSVPIKEIFDHLKVNISDQNAESNPALLLTVHNIKRGVVQYVITLKGLEGGGANFIASETIHYITQREPQRLMDDFTIDVNNLTILWKGAIDTPSVLTVQLA
ncbi:BppU family phage baseplate upper protein [Bacillus cereus]|nr:BppU family phage baseplate upper protein [Bacillus cereus]MDA2572683.1 BppU family phage baseplate upper protein [Bacillus cereus]